jgi:hypothetical protein
MTTGLKISCKNKKLLYEQSKYTLDPSFQKYFKDYKKVLQKTIIAAKKMHNINVLHKSDNFMQATWKVVRSELGKRTQCPKIPEIYVDNSLTDNPDKVSNHFNDLFINIGCRNDKSSSLSEAIKLNQNLSVLSRDTHGFRFVTVTEQEVYKTIKRLKSKFSSGWDEIPSVVVRPAASYIAKPITHIINNSIRTGVFPNKLKFALVNPIFKKGDNKYATNYRPVALLPVLSKIFEEVVMKQLTNYFDKNNFFSEFQYGFRKKRSTNDAIFHLVSQVTSCLDASKEVQGVFCDLSCAFDSVRHDILLSKLNYYGVRGLSNKWFKSYLSGRFQQVRVRGENGGVFGSEWRRVTRGVPQGSKLGPFLFLVFVNDLYSNVNSRVISFADDTSAIIEAPNPTLLKSNTVATIKDLNNWFEMNGLHLNMA